MRTRFCWIPLIAVLMSGCGSGEPAPRLRSAPAPTLLAGWNTWDRPGFSLSAPDQWSPFRSRRLRQAPSQEEGLEGGGLPPEVGNVMDRFEQAERQSDEQEIAKLAAEGIPLRLYDNSVRALPAETPTQLTVKVTQEGGLNFETEAKNLFNKLNVDKKSQTKVELPIGAAQEFVTETTNRIGDVVHQILYLLVDGENRYVFTFISTNDASAIRQVARPMMETFRPKP